MRYALEKEGKVLVMGVLVLLAFLLAACSVFPLSTTISTLHSSASPTEEMSASLFSLDAHRSVTAAECLPIALRAAKDWRQDAMWFGIIPFTSIERAFVIPLDNDKPSWYFRFGAPGKEAEYIVEVLDRKIVGTNETKLPEYIEPPLEDLEPLGEKWNVMDNVAALEACVEEGFLSAEFPHIVIDYRLVKPKERPNPVWTLYNAFDLSKSICILDAVTGEGIFLESR